MTIFMIFFENGCLYQCYAKEGKFCNYMTFRTQRYIKNY